MRHERSNENSEGVLDRYLADWAAVVEFRRDGGVGYPIGVSEGGGSGAKLGSGISRCGERYLEIERMLDGETVVRAMAERMYVGSVGTVHEYVAERLGRNRGMARALEAVYGGIWRRWRVRVIESLGLGSGDDYRSWADLKVTVDSQGRELNRLIRGFECVGE